MARRRNAEVLLLLLAVLMFVSGCAGGSEPSAAPTEQASSTTSEESTPAPVEVDDRPTSSPEPAPAGPKPTLVLVQARERTDCFEDQWCGPSSIDIHTADGQLVRSVAFDGAAWMRPAQRPGRVLVQESRAGGPDVFHVLDAETGETIEVAEHRGYGLSPDALAVFTPSLGSRWLVAIKNHELRLIDLDEMRVHEFGSVSADHPSPLFDSSEHLVSVVREDGRVEISEAESMNPVTTIDDLAADEELVGISHDGRYAATRRPSAEGHEIAVITLATGERSTMMTSGRPSGWFSATELTILTRESAWLLDVETGEESLPIASIHGQESLRPDARWHITQLENPVTMTDIVTGEQTRQPAIDGLDLVGFSPALSAWAAIGGLSLSEEFGHVRLDLSDGTIEVYTDPAHDGRWSDNMEWFMHSLDGTNTVIPGVHDFPSRTEAPARLLDGGAVTYLPPGHGWFCRDGTFAMSGSRGTPSINPRSAVLYDPVTETVLTDFGNVRQLGCV